MKKVFLKLSQNSQKDLCVGVFFNNVAGLRPETLLIRDSGTSAFL